MRGVCIPVLHAVAHNYSVSCQRALDKDIVITILVTRSLGDLRGVAYVCRIPDFLHTLRQITKPSIEERWWATFLTQFFGTIHRAYLYVPPLCKGEATVVM